MIGMMIFSVKFIVGSLSMNFVFCEDGKFYDKENVDIGDI